MQSSHTPISTSKIYLHMEQFSLKTNWRLSRRRFTTKAVRMRHTESTRKGREVIRLGPAPLGEDTEEEVGCTDSEILPGE